MMKLINLNRHLVITAGLVFGLFGASAHADWALNTENPVFTFVTTKAVNTSEVQKFKKLEGSVTASGQIDVHIDLTSVNTNIGLRDQRMREMLFEVGKFPKTAHFTGQLPVELLQQIKKGRVTQGVVEGQLTMHGQMHPQAMAIKVFPENGNLWVATTAPILVRAKNFGMEGGIEALRNIMGLPSISEGVAADFVLEFLPAK